MRVTNSMLVSNLMRNLHANYRRSDSLQNMMSTGRRFAHISDDSTSLIYSQSARNKMARLSHFQRTVETGKSWLTQAEISMRELQDVMVNAYEALIDAASDGKTDKDKNNIAQVVGQLRDHFVDTLNSTFGNNFVFGGYNTPGDSAANINSSVIKPFVVESGQLWFNGFNLSQFDGIPADFLHNPTAAPANPALVSNAMNVMNANRAMHGEPPLGAAEFEEAIKMFHKLKNDVLTFDVGPGITMPVTMNGIDLIMLTTMDENNSPIVRNAFTVFQDLYNGTENVMSPSLPAEELTKMIRPVQDAQNHMLSRIAEVGGRTRRLELLEARYDQDRVNNRQMLSDAQDVDMAEVIMELRMAEAVMQASMAAGARIIQPSLMDFLR